MSTITDKTLLSALSRDFPESLTPYRDLAKELGMREEVLLARTQALMEAGKIRRLGATLNHRAVGFQANALTVWEVPEEKIETFGKLAAARPEITHCYLRKTHPHWPYNLYTVIHSTSKEGCQEVARELAETLELSNYQLLFSVKELKKTRLQV